MLYRKDIQGLRALAVLLVFIFHLNTSWLPGGFIGVDIFFVISGYLISSIILHKIDEKKFSFLDFYKSRIKRIVPAYMVMLFFITVAAIFIFFWSDAHNLRKGLFYSFIFNSNNYFIGLDTYFGAANTENPLLHTWTLAVEMQIYFFLPLIIYFIPRKWLWPVVSALTIGLLCYSTYQISFLNNKAAMYFSTVSRAPEFFTGLLFSIVSYNNYKIPRKISGLVAILSIATIISCGFFITEQSAFPGFLALVPCIASGLLLILDTNPLTDFISSKPMVYIGELSYSIYLWHWPIMAFLRYYKVGYEFTPLEILFVTTATFSCAWLSYTFVENTFRKDKDRAFVFKLAPIAVIFCGLTFLMVRINKMNSFIPPEYTQPTFGLKSHSFTFEKVETFGDTTSGKKPAIFLIGDSHGLVLKSYLDQIGKKNHFSFNTITNDRYPPIPGIQASYFVGKQLTQYKKLEEITMNEIKKCKLIFFVCAWRHKGNTMNDAFTDMIKKLREDQHVIVLSDFPSLNKNPVRVNKNFLKDVTKPNQYTVNKNELPATVREIIDSNPRVHFVDLSGSEVFDQVPFYKDTLMYYDAGHLNVYGAKVYAEHTEKKLMSFLKTFNLN